MTIAALLMLSATAASLQAAPDRSPPPLYSLPPAEAAEILLRQRSRRYVSMTVDDDGVGLTPVSFATAPESAGAAGLCRADVMHFLLEGGDTPAAEPVVWRFVQGEVYKVVGEVVSDDGSLAGDSPEQARLCAEAGPVLAPVRDGRIRRYFAYEGQEGPWMAVAALQGAIRAAREGRYGRIECIRRFAARACSNAAIELGRLDLADLVTLALRVRGRDLSFDYILTAGFLSEEPGFGPGTRMLTIEVNGAPFPVLPADFRYGRTTIAR